ncbi:putative membrane protein [Lachnellula cervina]|uniref:Putative membrane protein n=1 Tax=Lachnellula cervina TaxID=1316786 RepID=A0A7D8UMZ9_9HELO|nr:putative membrane protein [Lachnellula cervina]
MPTPLDDTLPSLTSLHSPLHQHNLPSHHNAQFPHAQELDTLSPSGQRHQRKTDIKELPEDSKHLLAPEYFSESSEDADDNSMPPKSRRPKALLEPNGSTSSGGENGHTNGSMNNNVEYRRKNAPLDSNAVTTNLMTRESFSLDEPVPRTPIINNHGFFQLPMQDRRNFGLLVLLYFLQGVPMGLATGALGVFSLASYPYSLKLLWSPIVDAIWTPRLGRRKSWIMPIQMLSGVGMLWLGSRVKGMMVTASAEDGSGIWGFTGWWFFLVFMCATQDIAVDGWALTLLTPGNISYASTAQTVGLTAGQFMSYTVFLAFNAPDFANKWFRKIPLDEGVMTLGGYLTFWGWAYIVVTLGLAVLKKEEKTKNEDGIWDVYKVMWGVLKLKNIQTIIMIHLIAKIGFQANDAVTNLKLIDKGFSQEDLALTVLIDFPFEIGLGYYAGKWSTTYTPMRLWCWGFVGRLVAAVIAQITVIIFPANGVDTWYLLVVIAEHIFSTFTNTVMFVAISAFHARIADPVIGGTYMTLLATVSNLGGTFPRFFVLKLVDLFTVATCLPPSLDYKLAAGLRGPVVTSPFSCSLSAEKDRCTEGGGICDVSRDGYYVMNIVCVLIGVVTFWGFIKPAALKLQALPLRAWRIAEGST